MTDNEIIKALECCSHRNEDFPCDGCPAYNIAQMCMENLMSDALDLINRQKAEIERLSIESETLVTQLKVAYEQIHKLNMAKSEAIKEFGERLKQNEGRRGVPIGTINNLVKEMTEVSE